ncbi:MAG TPA: hypothetical protein VGG72_15495 [Bryobacteraceae bacterium]
MTTPVQTAQSTSSNAVTLPPGSANYAAVLSALGVLVGQEIQLEVFSGPSLQADIIGTHIHRILRFLRRGTSRRAFIPEVYTPEGSQYSSPFSVFGIAVGATSFFKNGMNLRSL